MNQWAPPHLLTTHINSKKYMINIIYPSSKPSTGKTIKFHIQHMRDQSSITHRRRKISKIFSPECQYQTIVTTEKSLNLSALSILITGINLTHTTLDRYNISINHLTITYLKLNIPPREQLTIRNLQYVHIYVPATAQLHMNTSAVTNTSIDLHPCTH